MAALAVAWPTTTHAHDPGLSSLELQIDPGRVVVTLSLSARDAQIAAAGHPGGLAGFASDAIELRLGDLPLAATVETAHESQSGASVVLVFTRSAAGTRLTIRSAVPGRLAPGHRQLVTTRGAGGDRLAERMLDALESRVDFDLAGTEPPSRVAVRFLGLGVRHILGGYDHLLFLAALLLGVTTVGSVVRTVSAFTVAHSLTLALAVLGLVRAPAAIVEPLIAASVVFVGVENLLRRGGLAPLSRPRCLSPSRAPSASRWKLTFAFGLIHGFGFAGALRDLGIGIDGAGVALPLASFNAGVEAGQIGVAMLLWPFVCGLQAEGARRLRLAPACSVLVVVAGAYWLLQRTLT